MLDVTEVIQTGFGQAPERPIAKVTLTIISDSQLAILTTTVSTMAKVTIMIQKVVILPDYNADGLSVENGQTLNMDLYKT